jgi:hypothetical protein
MQVSTLSADPEAIRIVSFISNSDSITVMARTSQAFGICPVCSTQSKSLHSNYLRQLSDLPWHGVAIRIHLNTRKFRCRNELCRRKVFCERCPKVVESYGRKTIRLQELFGILAFALGGAAGSKTAREIGLQVSGETLLRRIRRTSQAPVEEVKVLGVDDFAFRRGERYGTILVDLEKRKPIDLLPEREAATLAQWLKKHPEIQIISRDRAGCYAVGSKAGAPQAVQVADRFHLLKNLLDGFERFLSRRHQVIAEVFQKVFPLTKGSPQESLPNTNPLPGAAKLLAIEQQAARTAAREEHFRTVKELHQGRSADSRDCPPFEDEPQHGQKVFVSRVGTAASTELSEIFADSSVSALFTETLDRGWKTKQPCLVERNQSAGLSGSGSHPQAFSAKMEGSGRY